ncbi:hypothetical protein Barb6XT_02016 [Bacteroidales bacterium Barb6XT]|nr:hypothetical protein Barb6XT_02016 [Bacteroidales bacterium Barb6XT]
MWRTKASTSGSSMIRSVFDYRQKSGRYKRLCTVEGIGDKTAVKKMIVVTKGFTDFTDARRFCCHAGQSLLLFVRQQHPVA